MEEIVNMLERLADLVQEHGNVPKALRLLAGQYGEETGAQDSTQATGDSDSSEAPSPPSPSV